MVARESPEKVEYTIFKTQDELLKSIQAAPFGTFGKLLGTPFRKSSVLGRLERPDTRCCRDEFRVGEWRSGRSYFSVRCSSPQQIVARQAHVHFSSVSDASLGGTLVFARCFFRWSPPLSARF